MFLSIFEIIREMFSFYTTLHFSANFGKKILDRILGFTESDKILFNPGPSGCSVFVAKPYKTIFTTLTLFVQ